MLKAIIVLFIFITVHPLVLAENCTCENDTIANQSNANQTPMDKAELPSCSLKQTGREFCSLPPEIIHPPNCIPFPEHPSVPPPGEAIYSTSNNPVPANNCRRCDLMLTPDGDAVLVHCKQCFEISSLNKRRNK